MTFTQFGKLFSRDVDGIIYAQPLYVSSLIVGGVPHNVVFVATMHNTVYAFDADDPNQPAYWQKSMGAAVPYLDVFTNGDTNMYPEIGILSTPAIDAATNTIYVVAMTKEGANSFAHRLHALDLATGAEKFGGPVLIDAPLFNSFRQGQRPGLLLANGSVYFGFASFGDQAPYWGFQLQYNALTLAQQNVFNANPANVSSQGAGIWQSGCGAAVDASGNIYFVTGNSGSSRDARIGGVNYSECALKLTPSLSVLDFFMPSNVDSIDGADADFGGGGHVLLPDQPGSKPHIMICAGKNGQLYVIDRDNMTHYAADNDARIIQKIPMGSNKGTPVYWSSPTGGRIFIQNEVGYSLYSYAVALDNTKGFVQLTQQGVTPFGFQAHQMALSSNGSIAGSGIVWTYSGSGGDLIHQTTPDSATLHAFNAETLEEIYNSDQAPNGRDALGGFAKYNTPTVANGKVYVPSTGEPSSTSQLQVYGLLVDNVSPTLASVSAVNTNTRVIVVFSEPVEASSATNVGNYAIDHGVTVSAAVLGTDLRTVTLTTSALSTGIIYTLTANNINDRAIVPNTISPNSQKTFTYQVIPPTVAITAPIPGTTYVAPAAVLIAATAGAAPSATIAKVDFFLNGVASGTATAAPFSITIPSLAAGTYALTAAATDNNNVTSTSLPVSIKVLAGTATYGLDTRAPIGPYLNGLFPTLSNGTLPATLSATGAFAQLGTLTPAAGLIPYTVNSPLWSDAAQKERWLAIGNSGAPYTASQQIGFAAAGEWTFPNGAVFVKHFELGTDETNPNIKKRLETRFIVRSSDGSVYGVTYKWRTDNSDADLVSSNGLDEDITIATAAGPRTQTWHYPSRNECLVCHTNNAKGVLGVKTRQLNGNFTYPASGVTDNQLRTFNHLGLFNPPISESSISSFARVVNVTDTTASLENRARSYLDANCSFCHRPGGTNAFFDARYDTLLKNQKLVNGAVINNLGIAGAKVVVPKDIAHSVLYQRVNTLSGFKMPPVAHNMIDAAAVSAIADWINSLPAEDTLSVHFQSTTPFDSLPLDPSDVAGAIPKANWNNALGADGAAMAVLDAGGHATGATVSWSANSTWSTTPNDTPDEKVMAGSLFFGGADVTVSNVPFALYDVYLYAHITRGTDSPSGQYFVDSIAHQFDDPGSKTMSYKDYGGTQFWTESDGRGSPGHYLVWRNLNFSQLVISSRPDDENPAVVNGFQIVPVMPAVSALSPNQGLPAGGQAVTVKGSGFLTGASFSFGGVPAANIQFVDSQTYTMTAPAHPAGLVDVVYSNGTAIASIAGGFTYTSALLPVISTVVPNLGPPGGGTNITISGSNFHPNAVVLIGGENGFNFVNATSVAVINSNTITCTTPPSSPTGFLGNTMVQVINSDGTAGTRPSAFRYAPPAPTISAPVPSQGLTVGGNSVTFTGTGFVSTMTVSFGGIPAADVIVTGSTSLNCIVPASVDAAIGPVDVVVTDGKAIPYVLTLPGAYTYVSRSPELTASNGKIPGVCAKYYFPLRPDIALPLNGPDALDPILPYNARIVTTEALGGGGAGTIVAGAEQPYSGVFDAKVSGYLKIVTPGIYTLYTISADASLFYFGDASTAALVVNNNFAQDPSKRGGKIYLGTGLHRFTILYAYGGSINRFRAIYTGPDTGGQQVTIPDSVLFTDPAPVIAGANPDHGSVAGNTSVTLTGTGFVAGANVAVNGVQAINVHVVGSTSVTFMTPGGTEGELKIVVLNPNGSANSTPFTYETTSFRTAENPPGAVPGTFFRYYYSGFTATEPGGPLIPDFSSVMPFRVGTLPTAMYLPEFTIVYPNIVPEGFSFQYTGYLQIPSDGTYSFYTASDDGSRMYIGNYLVVDNNFAQDITTRTGNPIKLRAGLHKYTVQFADGERGFGNYVGWGSADSNPAIPLDPDAPHDGPPTTLIPANAFFYVPPAWTGSGASAWSKAANWNTDAGFGAFAPVQTDTAAESHVSLVLRFPAVGNTPYTAINDFPAMPLNVIEFSSSIGGNSISGNQLQFVGTDGVHYQGLTQPNILQLGSGAAFISAPIFVRDNLNLGGNGTGILTLSGALTNYSSGADIKNLSKSGTSTYVISGDGSGFTQGSILVNGGILGINSTVNAANVIVAAGTTLRGTGIIGGTVKVNGMLFPGNVSSTQTDEQKGTLTVNSIDVTANGGSLRQRVWLKDATHVEADLLTITSPSTAALQLDGTSTLDLRVQVPRGITIVDNLDVEIVHGGNAGVNTYSSGFGNLILSYGAGVSNMKAIYVNKDFVANSGDTVNIVATQLPGQTPVPSLPPASFNRIFVRFNNAVTPVKIDSFTAAPDGAGVLLQWTVLSEYQNAGFNIWRADAGAIPGTWKKVNATLVPGRITHADVKTYCLYDWADAGEYIYQLESINLRGSAEHHPLLALCTADRNADAFSSVTPDGIVAAVKSVDEQLSTARMASLSRALSEALTGDQDLAPVERDQGAQPETILAGRITRIDCNTDKAVLRALGFAAADVPATRAEHSIRASMLPTWLSPREISLDRGSFAAAKVLYRDSGVIKIPQSALPKGFTTRTLDIEREGKSVSALAATKDALFIYAPGYADDYTDKDAFFLTPSHSSTSTDDPGTVKGLFNKSVNAAVTAQDTVSVDYHDIYFDFSLRPYDYPPWFSNQYLTEGSRQSFTISTPLATTAAAAVTVNIWSLTGGNKVSPDHSIQAFVNGKPVGALTWDGGGMALALTFQIPAKVLIAGNNTIELVTPPLRGVASQISFVHGISVQYTKNLRPAGSMQFVNTAKSQIYEISGLSSPNVWIVDARNPKNSERTRLVPYETQVQTDGTYKARFTASAGGTGKYLVVPYGSELAPLSVTSRTVKPLSGKTEYLAVGPKQFGTAIQPLLNAHSKEGLRSIFVDQEEIFDYYGFGRYGPEAIRRAARVVSPDYLLLVGRTTYDYRNYSGLGVDPLCPTFLVSTTFWAQATSDSLFGDFERNRLDVAVGRLPVNTVSELAQAVKHILDYKGAPASGVRVHAVADRADPDSGDFAAQADSLAHADPSLSWQRNYLGITSKTSPEVGAALKTAASGGADWIVYVGHGNAARLGNQAPRILDTDTVQAWTGNVVFIQSTCTANWMAKDEAGYKSIAIQALTQPQGGIAASIASSTYTHSEFAVAFMNQLMKNTDTRGIRWGDALLRTQQWAKQRGGGLFEDLSKTEQLFGDPAMPIFKAHR